MSDRVDISQTFLDMPRWWHEGQEWLAGLPESVAAACARWNLAVDGAPMHGSNALVVPVIREGEPLALRMTPPDDRNREEVRALRFWDGRGTVRLIEADLGSGASLLERLDGERPLTHLPLEEAIPIIGQLMRRLAIPGPPDDAPCTAEMVQHRLQSLEADWERLGKPFDRAILEAAVEAGQPLASTTENLAVNGDLHGDQVLRGAREPWLAVDPLLLRGDIAYDLARILWTRIDEMASDTAIRHWFGEMVAAASLDRERARAWVVFRTVDYWLWGLSCGLTEDPVRCARLVAAFR